MTGRTMWGNPERYRENHAVVFLQGRNYTIAIKRSQVMPKNPLAVDWEWYNTVVILVGFLPFLGLLYLGPPLHMLEPTTQGLRQSFVWGMMSGGLGVVLWIVVMSRFTRESGIPFVESES